MIDSLFEIINDIWPLLAALYAALHGLITWLFKKKKEGEKSGIDSKESTEFTPPNDIDVDKAIQQAEELAQKVEEELEQKAPPRPKKRAQPTKPPEKPKTEPTPAVKTPHPVLTAQNIRQAIVVSEILGKPKSLRRD